MFDNLIQGICKDLNINITTNNENIIEEKQEKDNSIFNSIGQNDDTKATTCNLEDLTINVEDIEDIQVEDGKIVTEDEESPAGILSQIINGLLAEDEIKNDVDQNNDGAISQDEIQDYLYSSKDYDNNSNDLSLQDLLMKIEALQQRIQENLVNLNTTENTSSAPNFTGIPTAQATTGTQVNSYSGGNYSPASNSSSTSSAQQTNYVAQTPAVKKTNIQRGESSGDFGKDVTSYAQNFIGYNEADGSANVFMKKHGYTSSTPWCAGFVQYIMENSGGSGQVPEWYNNIGNKLYCPNIYEAAKNADAIIDTSEAQPGDIILFNWDGGVQDHVGIVVSNENGVITTIEGNSSNKVQEKTYDVNDGRLTVCQMS